jgi:hypothetical protein
LHIKREGVEKDKCPIRKCIRQCVLIVARNVKFLSSLIQVVLFTAENAGPREEAKEDDFKIGLNST